MSLSGREENVRYQLQVELSQRKSRIAGLKASVLGISPLTTSRIRLLFRESRYLYQ